MSGDEKEVNKKRLYVGNVPFTSTAEGIEELFAGVGGVQSAEIVQNRNGRSRGFAIVEMESEEKAAEAITAFNEYEFEGRTIFVRVDEQPEPRAERTVTPTRKLFVGNVSADDVYETPLLTVFAICRTAAVLGHVRAAHRLVR